MNRELKIRVTPAVFQEADCTGTKGNNKMLDIDSFSTQPAMLNCYGFPMNDIQAYETSQSESVARSVLQRVKVNPEMPDNDLKKSVDEQFADLCPANWDSPAEFLRYNQSVAEHAYKRATELRMLNEEKLAREKEKISFVNNEE